MSKQVVIIAVLNCMVIGCNRSAPSPQSHPVATEQDGSDLEVQSFTQDEDTQSHNDLDELWGKDYGRSRKDVLQSELNVKVVAENRAKRSYEGLVLPVAITNKSGESLVTRLPHEWHGGIWPETDLYASVTLAGTNNTRPFHPAYLASEDPNAEARVVIEPDQILNLQLSMDWPGTGSIRTRPLMQSPGTYKVRLLLVFRVGRDDQFAVSDAKLVEYSNP